MALVRFSFGAFVVLGFAAACGSSSSPATGNSEDAGADSTETPDTGAATPGLPTVNATAALSRRSQGFSEDSEEEEERLREEEKAAPRTVDWPRAHPARPAARCCPSRR